MTAEFVTKRPHKKSRGGCLTCKTRKVKCNEAQPICQFCAKRNLSCVYPSKPLRSIASPSSSSSSSSSSGSSSDPGSRETTPAEELRFEDVASSWQIMTAPMPQIMTAAGNLSIKDLRMLHQWSTATASNVAIGDRPRNTLLIAVPQLAFENTFLLNGILGIASLQVQRECPGSDVVRRETNMYRVKAVSEYRRALSHMKPGANNYEAALIMSILLVVLYSDSDELGEGDLLIVKWLVLYRGLSAMMSVEEPDYIASLSVFPIFQREVNSLSTRPAIPRILVEMLSEIHPLDPDYVMLEHWCRVLDALGRLYAGLQQEKLTPALYVRIVAWPSYTTQQFTNSAVERRPRVLVVLTYYLSFLKLIPSLWWTKGIPEREIKAIAQMVGPEWHKYMQIPLQIADMKDPQEMARLLLS